MLVFHVRWFLLGHGFEEGDRLAIVGERLIVIAAASGVISQAQFARSHVFARGDVSWVPGQNFPGQVDRLLEQLVAFRQRFVRKVTDVLVGAGEIELKAHVVAGPSSQSIELFGGSLEQKLPSFERTRQIAKSLMNFRNHGTRGPVQNLETSFRLCPFRFRLVPLQCRRDDSAGDQILILAKSMDFCWKTTHALLALQAGTEHRPAGVSGEYLDRFKKLRPETARAAIQFYRLRERATT